ncbi:MAG: hypothetical protein EOO09_08480 [Chitinophagaceae bacterium]|nr:MAG: hypothetical protein EOO09_08480 [Chitinophagaceae bacterium]
MSKPDQSLRFGLIGGGPAALFFYKTLLDTGRSGFSVDIFEKKTIAGIGMPYSNEGAGMEHITNVSGNEIPSLVTSTADWMKQLPAARLTRYGIDPERFSDYRVFPRLLFGEYLADQFELLVQRGREAGIPTTLHLNTTVQDIRDNREHNTVEVKAGDGLYTFDHVIICTGHHWPCRQEGRIPGYFDSPYPPAKLEKKFNHPVAIKGASLTAIDAVRTLARFNGSFHEKQGGLEYTRDEGNSDFRMVMHSINGLLPAVRFHLEDTHLAGEKLLTEKEVLEHMLDNDGYLSLDYIFEKDFKEALKKRDPVFYEKIKNETIEGFVKMIMPARVAKDAFVLFREEYVEAERSIRKHESVHWKELLATLSFAMNYPAKHFSAEDMQRLKKTLMPLISVVIAFVPQDSVKELMALHEAGVLELKDVDTDSKIEPAEGGGIIYHYGEGKQAIFKTFVNGTGQPPLDMKDFPFQSLVEDGTLSQAELRFRDPGKGKEALARDPEKVRDASEAFFLRVPGMAITDSFKVIGTDGFHNPRIRLVAVPYIGGYNPDYSGLDFCEEASCRIVRDIFPQ